ncbi:MAG: hypothetical protein J6A73_02545 [Lachnospiraceae bacterium]|nr:hypothetical protein [Lachnospiraceae bacterium]
MNSNKYEKMVAPIIVMAAITVFVCCCIKRPASIGDWCGYVGNGITVATILFGIYATLLWRVNPIGKTPKLFGYYIGEIESNYKKNGVNKKKKIKIKIKQTLFTIKVISETNINESSSVAEVLREENGVKLLYYTYLTNPKTNERKSNPIQYGAARMVVDDIKKISGRYWTTQSTVGDMSWRRVKKKEWEMQNMEEY